MRINLIKKASIIAYTKTNAASRKQFNEFLQLIKQADWESIEDVNKTFGNASIICEGKRIVFRIGGNNYRMICSIIFGTKRITLFVKFIGTHAEYDKINAANRQCTVNNY